ncbi:MAG: gliding motility-associated C-terminal domain-containing protein [Sphingobacteriales bacterium JAD_PAG50586_3]|nr:MAG: gliding motility-associated C-terminal domain-containing protein [Sphingobacteriales bacterium JAD_PAG50586_3]
MFFLLFMAVQTAQATHNRAGEITYRQVGSFTYEVTIVTYTKISSPADRPRLLINWGDNSADSLDRVSETPVGNDTKVNRYVGTHTYPGSDTYIMYFEDPNRNGGVVNIPNSINVPFYVQTTLVINPFTGFNSSPILLNPPIDDACVDKKFIHNPGAFDLDGDSLAYKLIECRGEDGLFIPGFSFPQANVSFTIDAFTGDMVWDSPQSLGEFNVAILIEEWRDGVLVGSLVRDMQIRVLDCDNQPPDIDTQNQICVEAGTVLVLPFTITDPDNDMVTLSASGGPFLLTPAPQILAPVTVNVPYADTLKWQTTCARVRKQPYQISLKAQDNSNPINLVDIETVLITVVGPAPQNLTVNPAGNSMVVSWAQHTCDNVVGYKIYRREGFFGYVHGPCETGVPAYTGYTLVATTDSIVDTVFVDNNNGAGLNHGTDYCYMIVAVFPDGVESYASAEVCAELVKDIPVITNASVTATDGGAGTMYVAWSKPTQINTTAAPGPYIYHIYRGEGFNFANPLLIDSLFNLNDTIYNDGGLNTINSPYSYRIGLINNTPGNRFKMGASTVASSVFLTVVPADNECQLSWAFNVPWNNTLYEVYRKAPSQPNFVFLDTTSAGIYVDAGLTNGAQYCYYVKSIGAYSASGFVNPIENLSQEVCATPLDTIAPCPPISTVSSSCDDDENTVSWHPQALPCADEVVEYTLYYKDRFDLPYTVLGTFAPNDTSFLHSNLLSVAGCYYVTATDSAGNESAPSAEWCVDNCPNYTLPNIFTPNNDGINDVFRPFPYKYVQSIDMVIYSRWGNKVFGTKNADILWKGTFDNGDKPCSSGTYYYVCEVNEITLYGIVPRKIAGFVELIMIEPVSD